MKLLESTKKKITEDKKGENVPHLEIAEVVLVHCNIVNDVPTKILKQNSDYFAGYFCGNIN